MEDNVFAAFSFSGPCQPSKFSRARRVPLASVLSRATKLKDVKLENAGDFNTGKSSHESCRDAENVKTAAKDFLPGRGVEKMESVEDAYPSPLTLVKEESRENVDATLSYVEDKPLLSALGSAVSPAPIKNKRTLHRPSGFGVSEEMEDFGSSKKPNRALQKNKTPKRGKEPSSKGWIIPEHWERAIEIIKIMRTGRDAPVDKLGPAQLVDSTAHSETQNFHVLVAAMISSQTRDAVTAAAMKRLHAMSGGLTIQHLVETDVSLASLEELLKPVGFYRQKAKYLKGIADILSKPPYCGSVPPKLDELMKLPGVGPKVAHLVLWVAFGMGEEGIIVDTNMRRVCCRLGWAPEGSTPEQVREALELWLPKSLWADVSFLFVGFGQQICKPIGPKCKECQVNDICPSAFLCGKKDTGWKKDLLPDK